MSISPAMGQNGASLARQPKMDSKSVPRPTLTSESIHHETRLNNQANPPPACRLNFLWKGHIAWFVLRLARVDSMIWSFFLCISFIPCIFFWVEKWNVNAVKWRKVKNRRMRIPRKLEKTKALEEKRQTPNPFNSAFFVFAKNNLTYTVFACVEPGSIYCSFFFFSHYIWCFEACFKWVNSQRLW